MLQCRSNSLFSDAFSSGPSPSEGSTSTATLHSCREAGLIVSTGPGQVTEAFTKRAHPVPRIRAVPVIWDCTAVTPEDGPSGSERYAQLNLLG